MLTFVATPTVASPGQVGSLTNGVSYRCTVSATNKWGKSDISAKSDLITPATVPHAPKIDKVADHNEAVTVHFTQASNNGGSKVISYSVACGSKTAHGTASPITLKGLSNGQQYQCTMVAANRKGSSVASTKSAVVTPATRPDAPAIISVQDADRTVLVSFQLMNNNGADVSHYTVHCGNKKITGTASPIAVSGLKNGAPVTCSVTATNRKGTSKNSTVSPPVTPGRVADRPAISNIKDLHQALVVSFSTPYDGGHPIFYYEANCGDEKAVGTKSPLKLDNLINGNDYKCTVEAMNLKGMSPKSPDFPPHTPATVPSPPSIEAVVDGDFSVTVTFDPSKENGGAEILKYRAYCDEEVYGFYTDVTVNDNEITVNGLANGKTVQCVVYAYNRQGRTVSKKSAFVTPAREPEPPLVLTVADHDESVEAKIQLTDENGANFTTLTVTCGSQRQTVKIDNPQLVELQSTKVLVTGLKNGEEVTCTAVATNRKGSSKPSHPSKGVVPAREPDAPLILGVSDDDKQVSVGFKRTSNNGAAIIDYTVECGSKKQTGKTSPIVVKDLTNGVPVTCTVVARNRKGSGKKSTESDSVTPARISDAPVDIKTVYGDDLIAVHFKQAKFNGGAEVTQYTAKCGGSAITGEDSPIDVTGLVNGQTYKCDVIATNRKGHSKPSEESKPTMPRTVPDAPIMRGSVDGNKEIKVSFSPPKDTGGLPVEDFTVSCNTDGHKNSATGTASPIVVKDLQNGKAYECSVVARTKEGTGEASGLSAKVTPATIPDKPEKISFVEGDGRAIFSFSPPKWNGGSKVIKYFAECKSDSHKQSSSNQGSPLTVSGLMNGQKYKCTIQALNRKGHGVKGHHTTASYVIPASKPDVPTLVHLKDHDESVEVYFQEPNWNGGSEITSYTTVCTPGNVRKTGKTSPLLVKGLTNGQPYTCVVKAKNRMGPSKASAQSAPATPARKPDQPEHKSEGGAGQLTVSFKPTKDNGAPIFKYYVHVHGDIKKTVKGTTSPIVVTGLKNGVTYKITLVANNRKGKSTPSEATKSLVSTVPDAPLVTQVHDHNKMIKVVFTAPGFNGGKPVLQYHATCGGHTVTGSSSPIDVTGLINGKAYQCTVTAENDNGVGAMSHPSKKVTPATVPVAVSSHSTQHHDSALEIFFAAPEDDGGAAISDYKVECEHEGDKHEASSNKVSPIMVSGLKNGLTYKCKIWPVNRKGHGPFVALAEEFPSRAPDNVEDLYLQPIFEAAHATFEKPKFDGGAEVSGYKLTCSNGEKSYETVCNASPCVLTGLTNSEEYHCDVVAQNRDGAGHRSPTEPPAIKPNGGQSKCQRLVQVNPMTLENITKYDLDKFGREFKHAMDYPFHSVVDVFISNYLGQRTDDEFEQEFDKEKQSVVRLLLEVGNLQRSESKICSTHIYGIENVTIFPAPIEVTLYNPLVEPILSSEAGVRPAGYTPIYSKFDSNVTDDPVIIASAQKLVDSVKDNHANIVDFVREACHGPLCAGIYSR